MPNLWRLEAQSGFFVYLPVENAEGYEPVDRIVFPHDGSGFELSEDEIYPSRKSSLEERLDEFFTEELMRSNQECLREMMARVCAAGRGAWVSYERPESSRWLRAGAGAHESWRSIPQGWLAYAHEKYRDTRASTAAQVPVAPNEPLRQREELRAVIRRFLDENQEARQKAIDWKLLPTTPSIPPGWVDFVERAARRTWDGVRRLPFTDDQVAESVAMTVVLACADVSETPSFAARDFSRLLGPALHMELANGRNVTARAAIAETTYERALRPDLDDVIVPELFDSPPRKASAGTRSSVSLSVRSSGRSVRTRADPNAGSHTVAQPGGVLLASSNAGDFLTPLPHTILHAGPHKVVHESGAREEINSSCKAGCMATRRCPSPPVGYSNGCECSMASP